MLAKNVNGNAAIQDKRGALEFFASKLAPTGGSGRWVRLQAERCSYRIVAPTSINTTPPTISARLPITVPSTLLSKGLIAARG